ncbi:MAG: DUF559 domain-containing protein [Bacteroidetes bacterium]|nr:DUF559 domain-containing protein [Bacteroidota bacterium]
MNLNIFNTTNLFDAATNLFQQLNIKLNSNTAEPLPTKDILKHHYKDNDTFKAIEKTYFIGIIDDSVFKATGMFDINYSYKEAIEQGDKNYNGLMLFALELKKQPTRTEISELTRTFNRISQKMPVALVLKYTVAKEAVFSIAISERFKYLQNWRQGEKAGKVIILRDIHTQNTHAGHTRILQDLVKPVGVSTYEQLHQHWLQVLDVSILNKKFFQDLSNWYFSAMNEVSFPDDLEKKKEVRNATNLIRLITRVIFIWFIKEKQLVPASLFRKDFVASILKDFNKNKKSQNYYNAILQNLFFGTLNQKMEERKFVKEGDIRTNKEEYGVKNLFRYADLFTIPEKEVLALFKDVPFLNGGLFDCLDKPNDDGKIEYVDGFSRNAKKQAIVPDYIFFGEEKEVDLNEVYGTKNKRYSSRGLINLLESYKFTVAENTPIEEEIALDPELLGKVFENLLASYNPETQTTARKQTGSFYTPREIVNYMVDESLLEYIKQNLKSSSPESGEVSEGRRGQNINPESGEVSEGRRGQNINPESGEVSEGRRGKIFNKPEFKFFRRELRHNLTPAEAKLWTLLQGKQLDGRKFRRQHSVDKYVLDFYCPEEKLAVELDGAGHFTAAGAEYDAERDAFIEQFGIKVLRFENKWVWDNPEGLLEEVRRSFNWSKQPPRPADTPPSKGGELFEERLRKLFSYSDEPHDFNEAETKDLIEAINNCKILDPACGSGAFPMGILHKMVHILQKLDPENKLWRTIQEQKAIDETKAAFKIGDKEERAKRLAEINDVFENNASDYGRKLYLIENCIYGIDIQPIAVQIAKLRFFISLVIDQKVNKTKENFGVRSLPNLETKFVAANTLIGLDKPQQTLLRNPDIEIKENQLKELRHQYFTANTRKEKIALQKQDKKLRQEIAKMLESDGWNTTVAKQIVAFDPYDQNTFANWFDPEWMFGLTSGFDIVIGNPPYGFRTVLSKEEKDYFRKKLKIEFSSGDSAELFCKISFDRFVKQNGVLSFIIPKKSLYGDAWEDLRINYWKKYDLAFILDTGKSFENVLLEASVFGLIKSSTNRKVDLAFLESELSIQKFSNTEKEFFFLSNNTCQIYKALYPASLFQKIQDRSFSTKKITTKLGLAIGQDFFSDTKTKHKLLKGIDIERYNVRTHRYLKNYENLKEESVKAFLKPKVIAQRIIAYIENPYPHLKITACLDSEGVAITNTLMAFETDFDIEHKFLLSYLNSKFVSWYALNFIYVKAIRTMDFYDFYIQQVPIPNIQLSDQKPFITLVDKILDTKRANPNADTSQLEKQIDELVYKLYDLTEEEIAIIENSYKKS